MSSAPSWREAPSPTPSWPGRTAVPVPPASWEAGPAPGIRQEPSGARTSTSVPDWMRINRPRSMTTNRRTSTVPSDSRSPNHSS